MISPMIDMRMTGDEIVALCGVPSSQSETAECFLETKRISGLMWCGVVLCCVVLCCVVLCCVVFCSVVLCVVQSLPSFL